VPRAVLKHGSGDTQAGERKVTANSTLKSYMLQEAEAEWLRWLTKNENASE